MGRWPLIAQSRRHARRLKCLLLGCDLRFALRPSSTHAACIGAIIEHRPLNTTRRATGKRTNAGAPPRSSAAIHDATNDSASKGAAHNAAHSAAGRIAVGVITGIGSAKAR
jgi:hypothetical protein